MPLEFGLQIATFDVARRRRPRSAARLAAVAEAAEDAGFTSLWVMDHFIQIPQVGRHWDDMLDSWTTLGFLAGHTRTGHARHHGHRRHLPQRRPPGEDRGHPRRAVRRPGRLRHRRRPGSSGEHKAYGWEFPPVRRRLRPAGGRPPAAAADVGPGRARRSRARSSRWPEAICYPRPLQERIPILVGGVGREAHAAARRPVRRRLQPVRRRRPPSATSWRCCTATAPTSAATRPTSGSPTCRRRYVADDAEPRPSCRAVVGHGGGAGRALPASWPRRACRRPSSGWPDLDEAAVERFAPVIGRLPHRIGPSGARG